MSKHTLRRLGRKVLERDKSGKVIEIDSRARRKHSKAPAVILFKEEWYEHIDENPIFIKSKKQLRQECESRGMIAKALD